MGLDAAGACTLLCRLLIPFTAYRLQTPNVGFVGGIPAVSPSAALWPLLLISGFLGVLCEGINDEAQRLRRFDTTLARNDGGLDEVRFSLFSVVCGTLTNICFPQRTRHAGLQGYVLGALVSLLTAFVEVPAAKAVFRSGGLASTLFGSYLALRALVTQRYAHARIAAMAILEAY